MRTIPILSLSGLICTLCLVSTLHGEEKDKKTPAKKTVKELMIKVHKGEQSPYEMVRKEVQVKKPDWTKVSGNVKDLLEMADHLPKTGGAYAYWKVTAAKAERAAFQYADCAKALDKATRDQDQKAAAEAFTKLSGTCVACHGYSVPR